MLVLGSRLVHDQRQHEAAVRAADVVAVVLTVNDWGVGIGGSAVVSVHASGRGDPVRVDAPRLRPKVAAPMEITGAPLVVAQDTGNQIRVRLRPDCSRVRAVTRLDLEVPVTPASGKRHVLRVPFPDGPLLLRRACGYLPVDEALTVTTYDAVRSADRLQLSLGVSNDSRDPLTLVGLGAPGLRVQAALPVDLRPRGPAVDVPVGVQVVDCGRTRRAALVLTARLLDQNATSHAVPLPIDEPTAGTVSGFVVQRCR